MITQNQLKQVLNYNKDTGDFIWLNPSKYHSNLINQNAGTIQSNRNGEKKYLVIRIDGKGYRAQRLAWLYVNGVYPLGVIDHVDGNSLNNKISNLRDTTHFVNNQNHTKKTNASGLPTGVRLKPNGFFQARIRANNKTYCLGVFRTANSASEAYKKARKRLHDCPASKGEENVNT